MTWQTAEEKGECFLGASALEVPDVLEQISRQWTTFLLIEATAFTCRAEGQSALSE